MADNLGVLLIHSDTTDGSTTFVDSSTSGHTLTAGNSTHHETDEAKFGASCIEFESTTKDYLEVPDSDDWYMDEDDWTVDFWIKRKSLGTNQMIMGQGPSNGATLTSGFIQVRFETDGGLRTKFLRGTATNYFHYTSTNITDTDWHHVALVRNGNLYTVYIDGTADGTTHNVTGYSLANSAYKFVIGQPGEYNLQTLDAYIDEFRLVKGTAMWTTDFTPPTSPYGGATLTAVLNTLEEPYSLSTIPYAIFEEPYGFSDLPKATVVVEELYNFSSTIVNLIEELYELTPEVRQVFDEVYGLKMGVDLVQWYSDSPVPTALTNEYYSDAPLLARSISERYDNVLVPLRNFIELYSDKPIAVNSKILPYKDAPVSSGFYNETYNDSPVSISSKLILYGDKPAADKTYTEQYGDVGALHKVVEQMYGDSLKSCNQVTELYDLTCGALLLINESWSVSQTAVIVSFEEEYALDVLNPISSSFALPYYLVSEQSIENEVNVTISVNGIFIDFISVDIDAGMDKYVIQGSVEVASEADYVNCPIDGDVECIIDGVAFNLFIETRSKGKTNASGTSWTIDLLSPTAKLDSPYSQTMVTSFTNNIYASVLVQQMADYQGVLVDWQIIDWSIPNYAISANDETPLAVIKKVVNAVGAIVQTKPNGDMLIISKYPISPKLWGITTPSVIFSSETDIVSINDSMIINEGLNAFLITDQGSSAADITLEEIDIDTTTKIIRGFRIPFSAGSFNLVTSGGPLISISKESNPVEANIPIDFDDSEEWEYIEFIDWVGTTQYPIYELIEWEWVAEDMGAFQISENGTLTTITQDDSLKESLLRIKYKTKYWKWTVRGPIGAYAQVYVPELETI